MKLRRYQDKACASVVDARDRGVRSVVLAMATGTGKTPTFVKLRDYLGIAGRVLVLVHSIELAQQAIDKIKACYPDESVGLEMAKSRPNHSDRWVVASIQSISKRDRLSKFDPSEFSMIVCDECHRSVAPSWLRVLEYFHAGMEDGPLLVGVTATLEAALFVVFSEVVFSYGIQEAITEGYLVPLLGKRMRSRISVDDVKTTGDDFDKRDLSLKLNTPEAIEEVVDFWVREGENRKTVGFCVDIDHGRNAAAEFRRRGFAAEAVWGEDSERAEKLARFKSGETHILLNCAMLIEGWDEWSVQCILMMHTTKSKKRYIQEVGRGGRLPMHAMQGYETLHEALAAGIELPKVDCLVIDAGYSSKLHTLQSLPSIFGMPPKMDIEGSSVLDALNEFLAAQNTTPDVDLSGCEDLSKLETYAETMDLMSPRFPKAAIENSEFSWMDDGKGGYILQLPAGEKVEITNCESLISPGTGYNILGNVCATKFWGFKDTLTEAFYFADYQVRKHGRDLINLLRRMPDQSSAASQPISEAQIRSLSAKLERMNVRNEIWPDWARMTRHDGRKLFLRLVDMDKGGNGWRSRHNTDKNEVAA